MAGKYDASLHPLSSRWGIKDFFLDTLQARAFAMVYRIYMSTKYHGITKIEARKQHNRATPLMPCHLTNSQSASTRPLSDVALFFTTYDLQQRHAAHTN
jgi:hypothetical protein